MSYRVNRVGKNGGDRRPWVIVSRSEAMALVEAVRQCVPMGNQTPTLHRALDIIARQVQWIDGDPKAVRVDENVLKVQAAARDDQDQHANGHAA